MKKLVLAIAIASVSIPVFAGYVQGYMRSDGTYVQGYYRTNPDNTVTNNYDYKGNVNPYTGETGTRTYNQFPSYQTQQPQTYNPGGYLQTNPYFPLR
jgi:hypothetical protein